MDTRYQQYQSPNRNRRALIACDEPTTTTSGSPSASIKMSSAMNQVKLPSHFNGLLPCFRESYFTSEYSMVSNQRKLGGLYVIPSRRSAYYWFGVIFVHSGPYQGGVFRFTIKFHENFPDTTVVPVITFQPPIFHPSIHPRRGTFELTSHFNHGWSKSRHHVWHLLKIVRSSFYKIEESSCNKAANDLLNNDLTAFYNLAQEESASSHKRFYEDNPDNPDQRDPHWIKFSPYNPEVHDTIRAKALKPFRMTTSVSIDQIQVSMNNSSNSNDRTLTSKGLSWMY